MDRPSPAPGAPWQPVGPPAAVITFRPWVRFGASAVMAVILAGIVIAVVNAVAAGDAGEPFGGSSVSGAGIVIGWVVAAVIGLLLLMTIPQLVRFRLQLWPDGFVARLARRSDAVGLGEIEQIDVRRGRQNAYNPVTATPVLSVRARDRAGRRRGFLLTSSYQGTATALPILDEWVRRRPDVVAPGAREVFEARGVLASRATQATAPPPGGFHTRDGGTFDPSA